ncbi:hypothetical protein [Halobellus rubicundus]|uniref:Major facilitator superfamily (MFS) profile domain-containing protein n=1 Tax=Halobellus rubicundus TaxID=2996466 RepID=A0ABD5MB09_9EURY
MTPAELLARLVGLLVAAAGAALAYGGLLVPIAGAPGVAPLARGAVANLVVAGGLAGLGFLAAGLAVVVDRGRPLAVSVGGLVLVAVVALLAVGTDSSQTVLGVGVVAAATLLAGASIEGSPA